MFADVGGRAEDEDDGAALRADGLQPGHGDGVGELPLLAFTVLRVELHQHRVEQVGWREDVRRREEDGRRPFAV